MKKGAPYFIWIGLLAVLATPAFAETRTISWDPVTTYTNNTLIVGRTIRYTAYWSADAGLTTASLQVLGASLPTTSTTFDPTAQRMTRGGTVYFTAKAVLDTGEESALSPAYSWVVPVVVTPVVLGSISVSGPLSVNENGTGTYTARATWDNGSTTSVRPTWSVSPTTYASIGASGVLTTSAVTTNKSATVTASYTSGGVTRTASQAVTVVNVANVLSGISVSGPSSVNESGTGTYTARATWDNGSTLAITPTWSVTPTTYASIGAGGVLTTSAVTSNQSATVSASYTSGGVTRTASQAVAINDGASILTSISVSGPSSVNEGSTGTCTATGTWDNGTTLAITPTWSVSTSYASISSSGILTAAMVTSNQAVTVTASYGGKTSTKSVTIVNLPGELPATPGNIGISGPVSSLSAPSAATIWRIKWDPVTTSGNGSLIESGRTVRYSVYWTDDPALSVGSLRPLGSLIPDTVLDFDPSANQMVKNELVYLTVRAILDTGDESSLSPGLIWRAENEGPIPPGLGKILKK